MIPLILTLLLAVGQASSPVPPKSSSKPTRTSSVAQDQPTIQKKPSPQLPAAVEAQATSENQNPLHEVGGQDSRNPVRISEISPVSVRRDWLDYATPALTLLLVIVGAIAACIGLRTISAIEKQADAMVKSDRAWVMVDLEKVPGVGQIGDLTSMDKEGPRRHFRWFRVRCVCSNQGQTAARIIEKRCAALAIRGDHELPESPNLDIEIRDPVPHYLKANGDPWHGDWTISVEVADSEDVQLFIIYGVVRYRHLFSDEITQTTFGYSLGFQQELRRLIGHQKYNENT